VVMPFWSALCASQGSLFPFMGFHMLQLCCCCILSGHRTPVATTRYLLECSSFVAGEACCEACD
jgi:hypothetical protein